MESPMSDPAHVIRPTPPLRTKVGGGFGINADAIARAEEALKAMSAQFGQDRQAGQGPGRRP